MREHFSWGWWPLFLPSWWSQFSGPGCGPESRTPQRDTHSEYPVGASYFLGSFMGPFSGPFLWAAAWVPTRCCCVPTSVLSAAFVLPLLQRRASPRHTGAVRSPPLHLLAALCRHPAAAARHGAGRFAFPCRSLCHPWPACVRQQVAHPMRAPRNHFLSRAVSHSGAVASFCQAGHAGAKEHSRMFSRWCGRRL